MFLTPEQWGRVLVTKDPDERYSPLPFPKVNFYSGRMEYQEQNHGPWIGDRLHNSCWRRPRRCSWKSKNKRGGCISKLCTLNFIMSRMSRRNVKVLILSVRKRSKSLQEDRADFFNMLFTQRNCVPGKPLKTEEVQ